MWSSGPQILYIFVFSTNFDVFLYISLTPIFRLFRSFGPPFCSRDLSAFPYRVSGTCIYMWRMEQVCKLFVTPRPCMRHPIRLPNVGVTSYQHVCTVCRALSPCCWRAFGVHAIYMYTATHVGVNSTCWTINAADIFWICHVLNVFQRRPIGGTKEN